MLPAIPTDVPGPRSLLQRHISPPRNLKTANEAWGTRLWLAHSGDTCEEHVIGRMGKYAG